MALPSWPASLPPLVGLFGTGGTDQLYDPPRETTFDDGPTRTRRQTLYDATPRNVVLLLTRAEFAAFLAFVRGDLNNGNRWFTADVRQPDGTMGQRTVKIRGKVAEADNGPTSRVSFTLMVRDW